MNDPTEDKIGFVEVPGKKYPKYDPSLKPKCAPIPETPHSLISAGGMTIGGMKVQPLLMYLPDSPYWSERWERGRKHLKEHGIENLIEVAGVHGKLWGLDVVHTYDRDTECENYRIGPGYAAGVISAYIMYTVCNVLPHDNFLLFECDAELVKDFLHHLDRELQNVPDDYDFVYIGNCCVEGKTQKHVKGNVYKFDTTTGWPMCSQTLLINKKCLPYIIETNRDLYASADLSLIYHSFPALNVYGIYPRLSTQYNNDLPR